MNVKRIIAVVLALPLGLLYFSAAAAAPTPHSILAVALGGAKQIALVNPTSGKLVKINVGSVTHGVGVLPNGRKAYVASRNSDEISVINLSRRKVIKQIDVGGRSHHIAISPDGRWIYVTVDGNNTVAVINAGTDTLTTSIPVGAGPTYAVFSPDGSRAYVSSRKAGIISVIDTTRMKVIKKITAGKQPDHLALTPDGRTLYVTNRGANDVSAIDTRSDRVVATIPVGKGPHGIAVVERRGRLLVAVGNLAATSLSLIDVATNRVVQTVALGTNPMHLTASPDRNTLYIGSIPTRQLLVYDVDRGRVVKRIDLGAKAQPHQIVVTEKPIMDGAKAVLPHAANASITVPPSAASRIAHLNQALAAVQDATGIFPWKPLIGGKHNLYMFVDPNCIWCHRLFLLVKLHEAEFHMANVTPIIVPVGFMNSSSLGKAATLILEGWPAYVKAETGYSVNTREGGVVPSTNSTALAQAKRLNHILSTMSKRVGTPTLLWRAGNGNPYYRTGLPTPVILLRILASFGKG